MKTRLALLLALALACALAPASALAATATPSPSLVATGSARSSAPVVEPADMQVQLWPSEKDGPQLVISADLAPGTKLPATVRIPLPAGATPGWVGEVSGGDVANDILSEFTIEKGTGGQVVVFTLTKYRAAQIEADYKPLVSVGDKLVSTLDWVQSAPTPLTSFAVKFGASAVDMATDPAASGAPQANDAGEKLYTVASTHLETGKTFTLAATFKYGTAAATSTTTSAPGGYQTLLIVLVVLLGAAIVAFVLLAAKSRGAAAAPDDERPTRPARREDAPDEDDPFQI